MDNFKKTYYTLFNETHNIYAEYINNLPKCLYESINVSETIISEMNHNIYPIPKDVLSFYVKEIFENGFYLVNELSMNTIIKMTKLSSNFEKLKLNLENLKLTKNKRLLTICLPYNEKIWLTDLSKYFNENEITSLFKTMLNKNDATGTYHSGFLIVINADYLNSLKDIEEVVEHELIHLFENIDNEKINENLSFDILSLLKHPSEYKTFTVNLMNRLDKIYDRYLIKHKLTDCYDERKLFLDNIFSLAKKSVSPEYLTMLIQEHYDDSLLLGDNMLFFWNMLHWKIKEFKKFKQDMYNHFLDFAE